MTDQLYKIKPLEWVKSNDGKNFYDTLKVYSTCRYLNGYVLEFNKVGISIHLTAEQAKEAAEKHYQDNLEQVLVRV